MTTPKKKNSSKTEVFWNRFEKSGSIQAYLKFHQARQKEEKPEKKPAKTRTAARP